MCRTMPSCSITICWRLFCSIASPLLLHQRSVDCIYVALFLGSLLCAIFLFVYSCGHLIPQYLDYYSFIINSWSQVVSVLQLCSRLHSFVNIIFIFLHLLPLYINFRMNLSIRKNKISGILTGIVLKLYIKLKRTDTLTVLTLSMSIEYPSIYLVLLGFCF